MKYVGLLCMAAAMVAGGFLMAGEWEARVKILLLFRQMMVYLKSRSSTRMRRLPGGSEGSRNTICGREKRDGSGSRAFFPESGKTDGGRTRKIIF